MNTYPATRQPLAAWADTLVGTNADRFVGNVIEETADEIVFESQAGGRMTITAPGVPKNYPDAKELVTEDCIRLRAQEK